MSITDDERFLRYEEIEATVQHELAEWRAIQDRPDYLAGPASDLDEQLREMEDLIHEGVIYRRLRDHLNLLHQHVQNRTIFRRSRARHPK